MIGIDTNVLARWILQDDEEHFRIADALLAQPCWVSWTVLLELSWLLGSRAKLERAQLADVLDTLLAMPTLHFERPASLQWAVDRYRAGGDIADMLHLATTGEVDAFVSFEKTLPKRAGADAPIPVRLAT